MNGRKSGRAGKKYAGGLRLMAIVLLFSVVGCGGYRPVERELVGSYEKGLSTGRERITLYSDGTFLQVFISASGQFATRGKWTLSREFLGPSEVILIGDYAPRDRPPGFPPSGGKRILVVRKEHGRLRLEFNEAADWYYDRVP